MRSVKLINALNIAKRQQSQGRLQTNAETDGKHGGFIICENFPKTFFFSFYEKVEAFNTFIGVSAMCFVEKQERGKLPGKLRRATLML